MIIRCTVTESSCIAQLHCPAMQHSSACLLVVHGELLHTLSIVRGHHLAPTCPHTNTVKKGQHHSSQ